MKTIGIVLPRRASSCCRAGPRLGRGARIVSVATIRGCAMSTPICGESNDAAAPQAIPVVFVVDDDVSVRESVELLVLSAGWRPQTFASARDFLARPRVVAPSCLVLDVHLPDLNGLDLQERIVDRIDMPIIFITGYGDVLLGAIQHALERSRTALRQEVEMRALRQDYGSLSRREREVMALVVRGLLNKRIGGELGISEVTVKTHRGRVMRKMKAGSLADLVNMAAKLRLAPGIPESTTADTKVSSTRNID